MLFKNPLDKKFAQWGKGKQVLSPNASMMKEKFLSSAQLPAGTVKQIRPSKFYFKILSVGLAVLVLFVGVNYYRNAKISGQSFYAYDAGYGGGIGGGELGMFTSASVNTNRDGYNQSSESLALQPIQATGLGKNDSVIGAVAEKASSFVKEFIQSDYQQTRSYPPIMPNSTIKDTREFSKVDYNSTLKTRDVEDVSTRILTTIRGNGGRVDDASVAERYASISFVVPKNNLLQFKTEIKSLVGKKFYVESLHIQNLLPEKVGIEDSTKTYSRLLSDAQDKLKALNEKHAKTIADLQRDLNNINGSIAKLKREVTTDPERQKEINAEIASLVIRQRVVQGHISDENTWYGWDSTRLEQDIKINQTQLDNLGTQERNLLDNVETVQGYVSVQWMSLWEMINMYVPHLAAWIVAVCILALIINYFSKRRTIQAW